MALSTSGIHSTRSACVSSIDIPPASPRWPSTMTEPCLRSPPHTCRRRATSVTRRTPYSFARSQMPRPNPSESPPLSSPPPVMFARWIFSPVSCTTCPSLSVMKKSRGQSLRLCSEGHCSLIVISLFLHSALLIVETHISILRYGTQRSLLCLFLSITTLSLMVLFICSLTGRPNAALVVPSTHEAFDGLSAGIQCTIIFLMLVFSCFCVLYHPFSHLCHTFHCSMSVLTSFSAIYCTFLTFFLHFQHSQGM